MLLETNNFIPQVYRKERDMQVFTKLLDMILTVCKYDIDNIGNVYDAYACPEQLLPLMAKTLNYEYNFADTLSSNRAVLNCFALMERYRGCKIGLRMATALSITSLDISKDNNEIFMESDYVTALEHIKIRIDYKKGLITIDYPHTYTMVRDLLDWVRPLGMDIELRSIVSRSINADVLAISANVNLDKHKYDPYTESAVEKSIVNFSTVADPTWLENLESNDTFSIERDD